MGEGLGGNPGVGDVSGRISCQIQFSPGKIEADTEQAGQAHREQCPRLGFKNFAQKCGKTFLPELQDNQGRERSDDQARNNRISRIKRHILFYDLYECGQIGVPSGWWEYTELIQRGVLEIDKQCREHRQQSSDFTGPPDWALRLL